MILLQIVRGLDRERFTPIVVLPDDMQHVGLLSRELATAGIECLHLPIAIVRRRYLKPAGLLPFASRLLRGTWRLRQLVKKRNVRVVHGFTLAVVAAPLLATVTSVPLIMHAHEILLRPRLLRRLLHALGLFRTSRLICVSEAVRQNILVDRPSDAPRLTVIHNGIAALPPPSRSAADMRRELGIPIDRPLIGMIGRISPWKGQDIFFEAAAAVLAQNPNCHFIAIGGVFDNETHHRDKLLALHKQLHLDDRLTLCDFRKDARELLAAFDIFILPSTSPDPFPTVVLEAMSAGLSVIATAHGGPVEMVLEGQTGLLVPSSDPGALAAAIAKLVADPDMCRRMGAAGKERMLNYFELSRYLNDIQETYDTVLNN